MPARDPLSFSGRAPPAEAEADGALPKDPASAAVEGATTTATSATSASRRVPPSAPPPAPSATMAPSFSLEFERHLQLMVDHIVGDADAAAAATPSVTPTGGSMNGAGAAAATASAGLTMVVEVAATATGREGARGLADMKGEEDVGEGAAKSRTAERMGPGARGAPVEGQRGETQTLGEHDMLQGQDFFAAECDMQEPSGWHALLSQELDEDEQIMPNAFTTTLSGSSATSASRGNPAPAPTLGSTFSRATASSSSRGIPSETKSTTFAGQANAVAASSKRPVAPGTVMTGPSASAASKSSGSSSLGSSSGKCSSITSSSFVLATAPAASGGSKTRSKKGSAAAKNSEGGGSSCSSSSRQNAFEYSQARQAPAPGSGRQAPAPIYNYYYGYASGSGSGGGTGNQTQQGRNKKKDGETATSSSGRNNGRRGKRATRGGAAPGGRRGKDAISPTWDDCAPVRPVVVQEGPAEGTLQAVGASVMGLPMEQRGWAPADARLAGGPQYLCLGEKSRGTENGRQGFSKNPLGGASPTSSAAFGSQNLSQRGSRRASQELAPPQHSVGLQPASSAFSSESTTIFCTSATSRKHNNGKDQQGKQQKASPATTNSDPTLLAGGRPAPPTATQARDTAQPSAATQQNHAAGLQRMHSTTATPAAHGAPSPQVDHCARAPPSSANLPSSMDTKIIWEVVWRSGTDRGDIIVRESVDLQSREIEYLFFGEAVEQIGGLQQKIPGVPRMPVRTKRGNVGFVTLDATAKGGPKFFAQRVVSDDAAFISSAEGCTEVGSVGGGAGRQLSSTRVLGNGGTTTIPVSLVAPPGLESPGDPMCGRDYVHCHPHVHVLPPPAAGPRAAYAYNYVPPDRSSSSSSSVSCSYEKHPSAAGAVLAPGVGNGKGMASSLSTANFGFGWNGQGSSGGTADGKSTMCAASTAILTSGGDCTEPKLAVPPVVQVRAQLSKQQTSDSTVKKTSTQHAHSFWCNPLYVERPPPTSSTGTSKRSRRGSGATGRGDKEASKATSETSSVRAATSAGKRNKKMYPPASSASSTSSTSHAGAASAQDHSNFIHTSTAGGSSSMNSMHSHTGATKGEAAGLPMKAAPNSVSGADENRDYILAKKVLEKQGECALNMLGQHHVGTESSAPNNSQETERNRNENIATVLRIPERNKNHRPNYSQQAGPSASTCKKNISTRRNSSPSGRAKWNKQQEAPMSAGRKKNNLHRGQVDSNNSCEDHHYHVADPQLGAVSTFQYAPPVSAGAAAGSDTGHRALSGPYLAADQSNFTTWGQHQEHYHASYPAHAEAVSGQGPHLSTASTGWHAAEEGGWPSQHHPILSTTATRDQMAGIGTDNCSTGIVWEKQNGGTREL